jgi:hypothetical protein
MKRGQFNFVWIFAILAGGSILALAIWGALQTGDVLRYRGDTQTGMSIAILLDPMQAGFSDSNTPGPISFKKETRIRNVCFSGDDNFGKNDISISSRNGLNDEWSASGGANSVYNKYIFSEEYGQGFDFYVFSLSYLFPYKVSDLIFLTADEYCFVNVPSKIEDEILDLNLENFFVDNCSDSMKKVCFAGGNDCDMIVYGSCSGNCDTMYDYGVVEKDGDELKYYGNLMWGAIFSEKRLYDCNVERLMYRNGRIADVFSGKADFMNARNCNTDLKSDLVAWRSMVSNSTSDDLVRLAGYANDFERKNSAERCGLW